MNTLLNPEYDGYRSRIAQEIRRGTPVDRLRFLALYDGDSADLENLSIWLPRGVRMGAFVNPDGTEPPEITTEQWFYIFETQLAAMNDSVPHPVGPDPDGADRDLRNFEPSEDTHSTWARYAWKLRNKGFSHDAVERIKNSCVSTIRRMCLNTSVRDPQHAAVKGLVAGSIQSGKTSHMAGLIAMASDAGFNFFIVLTGIIENLRVQTQERLVQDLSRIQTADGLVQDPDLDYQWSSMPHLDPNDSDIPQLDALHVRPTDKARYLTVCLKNAARLRSLIAYLQSQPALTSKLRILLIDDECDQGSVNVKRIDKDEESALYALISALCDHGTFNGSYKRKGVEVVEGQPYLSVNYVAYTGTPYATLLNDGSRESLFPRDFITPLVPGRTYMGGARIFGDPEGAPDSKFPGHPFLNEIPAEEVEEIRNIQEGVSYTVPNALKESLRWFIATVGVQRYWGANKSKHEPVSMLVHTAMRTDDHKALASLIGQYLTQVCASFSSAGSDRDRANILDQIERTYETHTARLTARRFNELCPDYGEADTPRVRECPSFEAIRPKIVELLSAGVKHIPVNEDKEFAYFAGIHFCVDNSKHNGVRNVGSDGKGEYIRIKYPDPNKAGERLAYEPAFLVIGGNTLARGLTLQGLTTTYFSRHVEQIDTLQQMGRFFGYRIGYELLPRIWISDDMRRSFRAATITDASLMDQLLSLPEDYDVKDLKAFIAIANDAPTGTRLTARNKSQKAKLLPRYAGQKKEMLKFSHLPEIQIANRDHTIRFLNGLGEMHHASDYSRSNYYVRGVSWSQVRSFVRGYRRVKGAAFPDEVVLDAYVSRRLRDRSWTVIVAGTTPYGGEGEHDIVWGENGEYAVGMVRRYQSGSGGEDGGWSGFRNASSATDLLSDISVAEDCVTGAPRFSSDMNPLEYRLRYANVRRMASDPILFITCVEEWDDAHRLLGGKFYGFGIGFPALTGEESQKEMAEFFVSNLEEEEES